MPLRVPAVADLGATLVFAHADRGHFVHERRRIGVGHVAADGCRIIGRVFFISLLEIPGQGLRLRREFRIQLEFNINVRFRALLLAQRAILARHAMIEQHHVVLNHPQPFRLWIPA